MRLEKKIIEDVSVSLGFEVNPSSIIAAETSMASEFIPFFNRTIEDQSTWKNDEITARLQFHDLHNVTKRSRPRFPNLKSLSAVVNPHTQQILKIASEWPEGIVHIAPFPNAVEEERQLLGKSERFVSLPAVSPPVDFFTAMKQLDLVGPVSPGNAKQVMAYLVDHVTPRYGSRTVWIIQTRGIDLVAEGYASRRGSIHPEARNHMRHIIDATTGQWLYSDTTPQPV